LLLLTFLSTTLASKPFNAIKRGVNTSEHSLFEKDFFTKNSPSFLEALSHRGKKFRENKIITMSRFHVGFTHPASM